MRDYYEVIGVRRNAGAEEVRRACRRAADADPWQDEVAIEFPSTARVLDRLRSSFADHPERVEGPLVAEICISALEARHGADVPLSLPVRTVCPSCGGRGEVWLDACIPCAGVGELVFPRRVRVTLPRGVEDGSRFRFALSADGGAPATSIELRIAVR
jgi:DnaJ-class molecular chaperone